jgi:site-specific DNA-methyltransferase (adenine-specific)
VLVRLDISAVLAGTAGTRRTRDALQRSGEGVKPYYSDDWVTLYHGDCLEITEWLAADVLVTDPPYGRAWTSGQGLTNSHGDGFGSKANGGIAGDESTVTRDAALNLWGQRPAIVFGDFLVSQPAGAVQCLIYAKASDAGIKGAHAGFRRDAEAIYLCGKWPVGIGGRSGVLRSGSWVAGPSAPSFRFGHPHAKPQDLLETLLDPTHGVVADPFAGSGSILVAAKARGRTAIGVEIEERYCEIAANRLSQDVLSFEVTA